MKKTTETSFEDRAKAVFDLLCSYGLLRKGSEMSEVKIPGCRGNTIRLMSGEYFDFVNPDPATIRISDIAYALAMTCRFGGHVPGFYSVAEHSVNAMSLAVKDNVSIEQALAILFHDAAEAFIGDVVKPLKALLPGFTEIEGRVEKAIEERFQISFAEHADIIHLYDLQMLKAEKRILFPKDEHDWHGLENVKDRRPMIRCVNPMTARETFIIVAVKLMDAVGRSHLTLTEAEKELVQREQSEYPFPQAPIATPSEKKLFIPGQQ